MASLGGPRGLASQLEILIRRDLTRFAPLPKQSEEKANAYGIPSVPVIAVNGRYLIAGGGSSQKLFANADLVIVKVRAEATGK